jgi:hypothetical protein
LNQQRFRLRYEQQSHKLVMPGDIPFWPRQSCIGSWILAIVLSRLANGPMRRRVYATVADAILPSYEELEEEDHLAGVLEGCLGGLLSCLEAQPELSVEEQLEETDRQALFALLFALWKHGCEYGIEVDEIPQALAQQATRDEQALMVQWVRQEKASDEVAGSSWLNRHLADFLALLTAQ